MGQEEGMFNFPHKLFNQEDSNAESLLFKHSHNSTSRSQSLCHAGLGWCLTGNGELGDKRSQHYRQS